MYSPENTEREIIEGKISKLNYLALLITSVWVLFLIALITFSPAAYPVALIVTAFIYVPVIIFIFYRVSKLRRRLNAYVVPLAQPMPVVVYDNRTQPYVYDYQGKGTEPRAY